MDTPENKNNNLDNIAPNANDQEANELFLQAEKLLSEDESVKKYEEITKITKQIEALYDTSKAESNTEEQEEQKGRDPEKFFNEVFEFAKKNGVMWNHKDLWVFNFDEINNLIDMRHTITIKEFNLGFEPKFIDENILSALPQQSGMEGEGIEILLNELKGKRVISIMDTNGGWFLKVVEE